MKLTLGFDILDAIKTVEYAAQSTAEKLRGEIKGINIDYTPQDKLQLVATDARRMAMAPVSLTKADKEAKKGMSLTIPGEEVDKIKDMLTQAKNDYASFDIERVEQDLAAFYHYTIEYYYP